MPTIRTSSRTVLLLAAGLSLPWSGRVAAATQPGGVQDGAGLFSAAAVERADQEIQEISRLYHKNLRVESFQSPSPLKTWILGLKKPENRGRFYEDWARELARKAGPDSLVILICREPAPLQVEVAAGRHLKGKALPAEDRSRIRDALLAGLNGEDNDQALLTAVHRVRETLKATQRTWLDAEAAFPWSGVLSTIIGLVGLWVCLEGARRLRRTQEGEKPARVLDMAYGGGGSFPAGLFATMNTFWLREILCGLRAGHPESPLAAECPPTSPAETEGAVGLHHDLLHPDAPAGGLREEGVDHLSQQVGPNP
jgi:uncharacterized membrane protein YgcG